MVSRSATARVPEAVEALARAVAAPYGRAALGVIFYGSCLRDGLSDDRVADFYVVISGYGPALPNRPWRARWHGCLPPTVYLRRLDVQGTPYRVKAAVLSLSDMQRASNAFLPTFWARMAQPVRLLVVRDADAEAVLCAVLARAVARFWQEARPLARPDAPPPDIWQAGLAASLASEFRAETPARAAELAGADPAYIAAVSAALEGLPGRAGAARRWQLRRRLGPPMHLVRLVKAAVTVDDGLGYLAWKITRHSGVHIAIRPWMRRWPVIAGLLLFIRLRRQKAVR